MLRTLTAVFMLIFAPAFADKVTVDTYRGPTEVLTNPQNVAVFDVSVIDNMVALGLKPAGILENLYVDYLDSAKEGSVIVGNLFEPDYEALAAMAPDLILAGGRSHRVVPDLEKIAPTVDLTVWEDALAQGLDRLAALGQIFGKEAQAATLTDDFNAKLDAVRTAVAGKGDGLILMTNGPKVSAYGANGRFAWVHTQLGIPEAFVGVEESTHGEAASFEFVRDTNPDILVVIDRAAAIGGDGQAASVTLDNALVRETNAWKSGNVIYLNPTPAYIAPGGIQSLNGQLDAFLAVLAGS